MLMEFKIIIFYLILLLLLTNRVVRVRTELNGGKGSQSTVYIIYKLVGGCIIVITNVIKLVYCINVILEFIFY